MGDTASTIVDDRTPARAPATTTPRPSPSAPWLDRACIIIPAFDAADTIGEVIGGLCLAIPECSGSIIVVDDGSRDATARIARELGCAVVPSSGALPSRGASANRGKGAALRAGFEEALARGKTVALTVDADGQHPADEARRVLLADESESVLVLAVRDLVRDGAPRANRFSNGISNHFLSRFAGRPLRDTQCGLRRYPVRETLALRTTGQGYDFEAEILLRAIWSGFAIAEEPVRVLYPADRKTHFRIERDVRRIIRTVLQTAFEHWLRPSSSSER